MGGLVSLATALSAPAALAAPLERYEAPPSCPTREAFEAEVARRTSSPADGAFRHARVRITRAPKDGVDGRLELDGYAREVHGASCREVTQALALALATALDASSTADGARQSEEEEGARDAAHVPPGASSPKPRAFLDGRWALDAPREREGGETTWATVPDERLWGVVGSALGGTSALGPGVAPEVSVFGGIERLGRSARLYGGFGQSDTLVGETGSAQLARYAVGLEVAPLAFSLGRLRATPLARFDAGVLQGTGRDVESPESHALPWLAVSAGGRLSYELTSAASVGVDARASAPLLHHAFFFRPNDLVYATPALVAEASISLAYRFSK